SATTDASGVAHFCVCATVSSSCSVAITVDGVGGTFCTSTAVGPLCSVHVPLTMGFQGILTDNTGAIVPDGNYNLSFSLYDASSGGTLVWGPESQPSTPVARGGFSVVLGMGSPAIPLAIPFDKNYWLGISVGGGPELTPRMILAASPYSLTARTV